MNNKEQIQSGEQNQAPTEAEEILGSMPGFNDRMERETAEKDTNLDPFWQNHPEVLDEAKELQAPLDHDSFKEGGYKLREYEDGSIHIWAPTPEYKEWLGSPEDTRGIFEGWRYEDVADKRKRMQREADYYHCFMKAYSSNITKDFEEGKIEGIFDHEFIYPYYPYGIEHNKEANRVLRDMKQTRETLKEEEKADFFAEAEKEALCNVGVSAFDHPNVRERLEFHIKNDEDFKNRIIDEAIGHANDRRTDEDIARKWIEVFNLDKIKPTKAIEQALQWYDWEGDLIYSRRHNQYARLSSKGGLQEGSWGLPLLFHRLAKDESWLNKYKEDIDAQISDLARSILSRADNQDNVDVILKEGKYEPLLAKDVASDVCLDRFKIIGGKTIKIPVMHSILNHVTGTKLKDELAKHNINLLQKVSDVYEFFDSNGKYYKEPYTIPYDDEKELIVNKDGSYVDEFMREDDASVWVPYDESRDKDKIIY